MTQPTRDESYCDVGDHQRCSGYTEDERDPETCMCACHDADTASQMIQRTATFILPCWALRTDPVRVVRSAADFTRTYALEQQFQRIGPLRWARYGETLLFVRDELDRDGQPLRTAIKDLR